MFTAVSKHNNEVCLLPSGLVCLIFMRNFYPPPYFLGLSSPGAEGAGAVTGRRCLMKKKTDFWAKIRIFGPPKKHTF